MFTAPRLNCGAFALRLLVLVCLGCSLLSAAEPGKRTYDLPAADAESALKAFSAQSGRGVIAGTDLVAGIKTNRVQGDYTPNEALDLMLANTGLVATVDKKSGTFAVRKETGAERKNVSRAIAQDSGRPSKAKSASDSDATEGGVIKLETFEVMGSKLLNMDKPRSRDDAQPYVVFDREQIERSQAANLDDFFRTRLSMNTQKGAASQVITGNFIPFSSINLRGLGASQTLILVDGRRMPSVSGAGSATQPDLNGIPLMAVERIEVLPSSASGIYGGGATGGVINIILRRDYIGTEIKGTYTNTVDTDTGTKRIDVGSSFSLEEGRTQVMFSGSWSVANSLVSLDRNFIRRGIALQMANNPSVIMNNSTPFLGATPNIRSTNGSVLVLDPIYGGASLGSNITYVPAGYTGPASDNGAALVANAGKYNLNVPYDYAAGAKSLLSAPKLDSLMLTVRRKFGSNFDAFIDLSRTENTGWSVNGGSPTSVSNLPADAPNNPFQQAINVRFPSAGGRAENRLAIKGEHVAIGLIARLPHDWLAEWDWNWNRSSKFEFTTSPIFDDGAQNALNTGLPPADGRPALNALQDGLAFPRNYTPYLLPSPNFLTGPNFDVLSIQSLRLAGPLFQLPGGPLAFTGLVEHRIESMKLEMDTLIDSSSRSWQYAYYPDRSQKVWSYYAEAHAPLFAKSNALPGVQTLDAQLSVRRDEYVTRSPSPTGALISSPTGPFPTFIYSSNSQASTNYTAAVSLAPVSGVALRGGVSSGFLPASVSQLAQQTNTVSLGVVDAKRGNTTDNGGLAITLLSGGNSSLRPETSRNTSAGMILTPRFFPGFRLSVDYTRIKKTGEITTPSRQFIIDHEDEFPGRVVRGNNLPGDPAGWAGVVTRIDTRLINLARSEVEAYDMQADYNRSTQWGEFHGYAIATYQPHYWQQTLPTSGIQENAGFSNGPLKWRGNLGLDWKKGAVSVGWNMQYYHSYFAYNALPVPLTASQISSRATTVLNQGSDTIPSQIYHDFIVSYHFGRAPRRVSWLADCELSVGLQNIFNTSPPILAVSSSDANGYSTYGDPRMRRYTVSIRKQFGR